MRFVLLAALALGLAPAAMAVSETPDPCALLTNAAVTKALGYKVQDHTSSGSRLVRTCTWEGPAIGYSGTHPRLMVQASRMSEAVFNSGHRAGPVPGLGPASFEGLNGAYVSVWQRGVNLTFQFTQASPTSTSTVALVKIALKRASSGCEALTRVPPSHSNVVHPGGQRTFNLLPCRWPTAA